MSEIKANILSKSCFLFQNKIFKVKNTSKYEKEGRWKQAQKNFRV